MRYKFGDKVRIVKNRTDEMNLYGKMDEWLGKTVTISIVGNGFYRIEEDCKGWLWTDDMIEGKVEDNTKEENHSSDYYLFKYLYMKLSEKEAELTAKLDEIKKIQKEIKEVLDSEG